MKIIKGDLIKLAKEGRFDVIVHGCNCFCTQGAGIAKQMKKEFNTDKFPLEKPKYKGSINKLGCIDYKEFEKVTVVNAYTQYNYGKNHSDGDKNPLDYEAFTLCMRKINHRFKGLHIGLPKIGCGLAGGSWNKVKEIINKELKYCNITIVKYKE